jgi:tetratricopeptide (TPR) repeat protein
MLRYFITNRFSAIILTRTFKQNWNLVKSYTRTQQKDSKSNTKILLSSTGVLATLSQLLFNKENDDALILLIKKGLLAQSRMKYADAEDYFHEAIKLHDKMDEKNALNPIYRVNIYLYIANLYLEARDYERSFRLFQECLRELIAKLKYARNHEAIIEISLKLSNIFAHGFNSIHDAKVGYEFCIEAILSRIKEYELKLPEEVEKDLINAKVLFIMILHTYGRYLLNLKETDQALSLLEQAKIMTVQLHQKGHVTSEQLGTVLNDLALALYAKKNYNEAVKVFNLALRYLDNELKTEAEVNRDDDEDYNRRKFDLNECKLVNLSNLCSSYYALKDYGLAKENCTKAIMLFNKNNFDQKLVSKGLVEEINEIRRMLNDINLEIKKDNY